MTNFPFELSKQVKHIDIVKTRTACINNAFTAIETAKLALGRLEKMAAQRADGKLLDIHTVAPRRMPCATAWTAFLWA